MFSSHSVQDRSDNPLFDRMVADRTSARPAAAPITTMTRYLQRATAPASVDPMPSRSRRIAPLPIERQALASIATGPLAPTAAEPASAPRPSGRRAAQVSDILREPLSTDDLTAAERAVVTEMGGTVARLILQMLNEDGSKL